MSLDYWAHFSPRMSGSLCRTYVRTTFPASYTLTSELTNDSAKAHCMQPVIGPVIDTSRTGTSIIDVFGYPIGQSCKYSHFIIRGNPLNFIFA